VPSFSSTHTVASTCDITLLRQPGFIVLLLAESGFEPLNVVAIVRVAARLRIEIVPSDGKFSLNIMRLGFSSFGQNPSLEPQANGREGQYYGEEGHRIVSGDIRYLLRYAQEAAFREDARRVDNGTQLRRVTELALHRGPSVDFAGYYQRHIKAA
jgi:hypothetical protein